MASSRKSQSSDLVAVVRGVLAPRVARGARVVLGFSGGVDSTALLDALVALAPGVGFSLAALHVHHGISPKADDWAAHCVRVARRYGVPIAVERVDIAPFRRLGLEGAARAARYGIYARAPADFVLLAHHCDDQAETLLVQLVRGTGLAGLAGMPAIAPGAAGQPEILRPLLELTRLEIEAYAAERRLDWIEDESNADPARRRSFVRHRVMPALRELRADAAPALARSAGHVAEAMRLAEDLARIDEAAALDAGRLTVAGLAQLAEPRARNLLRFHLAQRSVPLPESRALAEMLRQLVTARGDRNVEFRLGAFCVRRYRGVLWIDKEAAATAPGALDIPWSGGEALHLPTLSGTLRVGAYEGEGIAASASVRGLRVRTRRGGERLRLHERSPRRALKDLLQESGVPPWRRGRLPLVFCGDDLAWAPGVGTAWEFRARPGEAGLLPHWEPA
ncbi:MAG: tRNA lysidine(34) synthetase TilS [Burkholderiales bacterium]|jgi:tRNA(Ile)-lysidine synthase|nr:tRNA lysidine(34) synthetase TilS [Burkholderiales bacterium]